MSGDEGAGGRIHGEHPFREAPEQRDPARRFRGRLAAPVTVVTAGRDGGATGMTVSSMLVAEGEPPMVAFLAGEATDLWLAVAETGRFVVHVLPSSERVLADVMAGLRPSPGGLFAGQAIEVSAWGPELAAIADRVRCTFGESHPIGYQRLVIGRIDEVAVSDLADPLVYFRGGYRRID